MEVRKPAQKQVLPLNSNSYTTYNQDFAIITTPTTTTTTTNTNSVVFGSTILSLTPTQDLPHSYQQNPASHSNYRDPDHYSSTPSSTPSPSPRPRPRPSPSSSTGPETMIRYRECQRNHAAHLGSHVVDGCGEFMPSGDDGTPQALRCAACDCHRNFHRREVDGETLPTTPPALPPPALAAAATANASTAPVSNNNCYISFNKPHKITPVSNHRHNTPQNNNGGGGGVGVRQSSAPVMMAFGSGGAAAESSSDDLNAYRAAEMGGQLMMEQYGSSKKRFRTKFTQEQKDRMLEFAERIGWRIQKQEEADVQQLCHELGIKRQVFKVWMHNNKQAMKRKL